MGDASDRIRSAALLARAFPQAPVLIAGGVTFPTRGSKSESQLMADLLTELGVDRERQILEGASRTTAENARNAAAASPNSEAPWLLVTSAFHTPRAVGAFRAEGLAVIAAPTDWQIDPHAPWQSWSAAERLRLLDLSVKEYLGMLAYYLTGRSPELIPAPSQTGCLAHECQARSRQPFLSCCCSIGSSQLRTKRQHTPNAHPEQKANSIANRTTRGPHRSQENRPSKAAQLKSIKPVEQMKQTGAPKAATPTSRRVGQSAPATRGFGLAIAAALALGWRVSPKTFGHD
jgi:hypothetical protein